MYRLLIVIVFSLVLALALAVSSAAQEDMQSSTNPVLLMSGTEVEGSWSTLTRYDNGVKMTIHTSGLTPNDVVTAWWVIFNEPDKCVDNGCGMDDLIIVDEAGQPVPNETGLQLNMPQVEATQNTVLGATGILVPESGEGHFMAWLGLGEIPGALWGPGLLNPQGAEIHLILHTHGQMIPDLFDEQLATNDSGGCDPVYPNEPCADVQYAVHKPPQ